MNKKHIDVSKYMKHNGVSVYISWKEYLSISSAMGEIAFSVEGSDDEYRDRCQNDLDNLKNVIRKFKNAKWLKDNK